MAATGPYNRKAGTVAKMRAIPFVMRRGGSPRIDRLETCLTWSAALSAITKIPVGDKEGLIINRCHPDF